MTPVDGGLSKKYAYYFLFLGISFYDFLPAHSKNVAVSNILSFYDFMKSLHFLKKHAVFEPDPSMRLILWQQAVEQLKFKKLVYFVVIKVSTEDGYLKLSKSSLSQELSTEGRSINEAHKSERVVFI